MKKVNFITSSTFESGNMEVHMCGDGEIRIYDNSLPCEYKVQLKTLIAICDKAYAHKIAYEDQHLIDASPRRRINFSLKDLVKEVDNG